MANNTIEWRISNALFEAMRYREEYNREGHAVVFDGYDYQSEGWGLFVKTYTDTDGKTWDMIEICECDATYGDQIRWKADITCRGLTFAEMVNAIDTIITSLSPLHE